MSKLLALVLLSAVLAVAGPITYTLNNAVGAGNISGSIQTDGTIGVLGDANLLDWNLLLDDGVGTFNLLGPLSGNNSGVDISGSDLSATATQLLFNFSGSGFALFQNPSIGSEHQLLLHRGHDWLYGCPGGRIPGTGRLPAIHGV